MSNLNNNAIIASGRTDSTASQLTPDNLLQRLDLDGAFLNVNDQKELLQIPVRVMGNYKRSILSLTENTATTSYLVTYPDPTDNKLFYVSTLDGLLLQKTTIGDDGIGINEVYNTFNNSNTNGRSSGGCSTNFYVSCSEDRHSFESGNAIECAYWTQPGGTPPALVTIEVICPSYTSSSGPSSSGSPGSPGNSGSGTSGGVNNGNDTGFEGAPLVKGGGSIIDPNECVPSLDCQTCNLGAIDIDSDCDLSSLEVTINSINNCYTNGVATADGLSGDQKNVLFNNPQLAFDAAGALTIVCNPDVKAFLLEVLDVFEDGDEVDFEDQVILDSSFVNNEKAYCTYKKLTESTNYKTLIANFTGEENPNLTFKVETIANCNNANNPSGCTEANYNSSSFFVDITIDENYVNGTQTPTLFILRTIIHETIHANLYLALYNLNQGNTTNLPSIDDFPAIYEQFRQYKDWQHEFMAEQYIGLISDILEEVHPLLNDQSYINSLSGFSMTLNQFYEAISYLGLNGTVAQTNYLNNQTNSDNYQISFSDATANSTKTPNCN